MHIGRVNRKRKSEVLKNIYLSLNVQLKLSISEKAPDNFANLYVPGLTELTILATLELVTDIAFLSDSAVKKETDGSNFR